MAFYRGFLGLEPPGEPQEDGVPEPLQFHLSDTMTLMLIPTGGLSWVVGEHRGITSGGDVEVLLGLTLAGPAEIDEAVARAVAAGGTVHAEAAQREWGYRAIVADPDGHLWHLGEPAT